MKVQGGGWVGPAGQGCGIRFQVILQVVEYCGGNFDAEKCAERAGMDASCFMRDETDAGQREVEEKMEDFRTMFICSGVPLFAFDGTYFLSRNQPP